MGYFDETKVSEILKLNENEKISALIALGYPDEEPKAPKRKEIIDIVKFI